MKKLVMLAALTVLLFALPVLAEGTITATPQPCAIAEGATTCAQNITWTTTANTTHVQILVNGQNVFACKQANTGLRSQIMTLRGGEPGKALTLYAANGCQKDDIVGEPLARQNVWALFDERATGDIRGENCTIPSGEETCQSTLTWKTANLNTPAIQIYTGFEAGTYAGYEGGNFTLMRCAKSNEDAPNSDLDWVRTSHTTGDWMTTLPRTFHLYSATDCEVGSNRTLLDSITLQGRYAGTPRAEINATNCNSNTILPQACTSQITWSSTNINAPALIITRNNEYFDCTAPNRLDTTNERKWYKTTKTAENIQGTTTFKVYRANGCTLTSRVGDPLAEVTITSFSRDGNPGPITTTGQTAEPAQQEPAVPAPEQPAPQAPPQEPVLEEQPEVTPDDETLLRRLYIILTNIFS